MENHIYGTLREPPAAKLKILNTRKFTYDRLEWKKMATAKSVETP